MNTKEPTTRSGLSRRSFLTRASVVGGATLLPFATLGLAQQGPPVIPYFGLTPRQIQEAQATDLAILQAAGIAEALAVTTYTNLLNTSFISAFAATNANDYAYLTAALAEEMSHYNVLTSVSNSPTPYKTFYFPTNMFTDPQVAMNTLVTLEDAFIAAYLVGVGSFSTAELRVAAARIMGIESDHRSLARVVAADLGLSETTGAQGVAEPVSPANDNGYERTLGWTNIGQAVDALLPFISPATKTAGFDYTTPYQFVPVSDALPNPLGDF